MTSTASADDALEAVAVPVGPGRLAGALAGAQAHLRDAVEAAQHLGAVSASERRSALDEVAVLRRLCDATLLALAGSFDRLELDGLGAASTVDLLAGATGVPAGLAKRLEQVSRATGAGDGRQPAMPAVTAVHAAGRLSTEVFELAARTLRLVPRDVRREVADGLDAALAEDLPGLTHEQAVTLCAALLDVLDPSRADGDFDADAFEKRGLDTTRHEDGSVSIRGLLDPVAGAQLLAALDRYSEPDPTVEAELAPDDPSRPDLPDEETTWSGAPAPHGPDGPELPVRDGRTPRQRRADALGIIALQGSDPDTTRGGEPPRIIVTATEEQVRDLPGAGRAVCEQTGPLPRPVLLTLLSRAVIQAVVLSAQGADASVLALGQSVRCFTPPQRRALFARDGGCVVPGCTAHLGWLQAHHVKDWRSGGDTDLDNGVLLCPRHHLQVTLGVWEVRMVDGAPQVRPPATVDPLQRWMVNPRRALAARARLRAEQLRLDDLDDPPDDGAGWRFAADRAG